MQLIEKLRRDGVQLLLFDFDFTIGDSSDAVVACVNHALESLHIPGRTPAEIRATIGRPLESIFQEFAPDSVAEATELFVGRATETMVASTRLLPGTDRALRELRTRWPGLLGLVSSKRRAMLDAINAALGIAQIFDVVVGVDDADAPKPSAAPLLHACGLVGCEPAETVYVGDSVVDAAAAASASMRFFGVASGPTSKEALERAGAEQVFANLAEALGNVDPLSQDAVEPEPYRFTSETRLRNEIVVTTYKASGPGGQKRNKTESAVRIRHVPTGIIVVATESRSQSRNRRVAFERLVERLVEREKKPAKRKKTRPSKKQVQARLDAKKRKSEKKQLRRPPAREE